MIRSTTSGPNNAKIAIVGEAFGAQEEIHQKPFMGAAGKLLTDCLTSAGIPRESCFITNVFHQRPPNNDVLYFFGSKKESASDLPAYRPGKYLKADFRSIPEALFSELAIVNPNITIALGATALWALTGQNKISNWRGVAMLSQGNRKVLASYHPAAVLRQWELRPILIADLMKANRESITKELYVPKRRVCLAESIEDILSFVENYIKADTTLAFDIETSRGHITSISFAPSESIVIVIPFRRADWSNYWPDATSEVAAWNWVKMILTSPCPKVAHNGVYDIQYLWMKMGIPVKNYTHDTMLLSHSLQPELQKGLGFLGSIYTNEIAWKEFRKQKDEDKPED